MGVQLNVIRSRTILRRERGYNVNAPRFGHSLSDVISCSLLGSLWRWFPCYSYYYYGDDDDVERGLCKIQELCGRKSKGRRNKYNEEGLGISFHDEVLWAGQHMERGDMIYLTVTYLISQLE